jgi:uncharacterized protein YraI
MQTPRSRGPRDILRVVAFLVVVLSVSGLGSAFLPSADRIALAQDGQALGDTMILAGPGGQYGILTVAPAGAVMSVDGDPVDGYYPVTYDGISGWTTIGMLQVADGGGNGRGGGRNDRGTTNEVGDGGVETVTADPIYSDGSAPVEAASAEPVTGGEYGPGGASYSEEQIVDIIYEAADSYGQSRDAMLRVARCESGLDPNAVGGGGAWHGLFQFVPSTFAGTPYGEYDIYDPWANANAAAWMWSEGQQSSWVCQ